MLRTPVETRGEDMTTVADFEVSEGETVPFVLTYGPSHLPVPEPIDPAQALAGDRGISGPNGAAVAPMRATHRDLVMRSLITLKALTYRADRRHRRGADHLAAGKARRREELGLSLLLAARRHLHAARADELRLYRGGLGLAQLAAARGGGFARPTCRSCTASGASGGCWNGRRAGCPAMKARSRSGSAMPRMRSCSSMSTAN